MKKALAIYGRTSGDEQTERHTVEAQLVSCREWCASQGYTVAAEYVDEGVSGTIPFDARPAGRRLLADLEGKRFSGVVLFCVDRLSRDNETGVPAYNTLHRKTKGQVYFVVQTFDETPEGRLQFHIFLAIAEYERGVIARRTMKGQKRALRDGHKGRGRTPFGYRWNAESKTFDVQASEANLIRSIFQRHAAGEGVKAIAIGLTESGVPSPDSLRGHKGAGAGHWQHATVHRLLTRECYATGEVRGTFQGEEYCLPIPAIVTPDLYAEVQARLEAAKHFPRYRGTRGLFQGLIHCGTCGRTYHRGNYGGKQSATYFCPGRLTSTIRMEGTAKCQSPNIKLVDTDAALWRGLLSALRDPGALATGFLAHVESEIAALRTEVGDRSELGALREKRNAAVKYLTRPGMSVATVEETIAELDKQIDRAERRLLGKENEVRRLELLDAQKASLRRVIDADQTGILEVTMHGTDGLPVAEDDLGDWLASRRSVIVTLAAEIDPPPDFSPAEVRVSPRVMRTLSRTYVTTADALVDFLGVGVTVMPDGDLRLVGSAIYWQTDSQTDSAGERSSRKTCYRQVSIPFTIGVSKAA